MSFASFYCFSIFFLRNDLKYPQISLSIRRSADESKNPQKTDKSADLVALTKSLTKTLTKVAKSFDLDLKGQGNMGG